MADTAVETQWQLSFPDKFRPDLYSSEHLNDDGWYPLTEANNFLVSEVTSLTTGQLYTLAANNAETLQKAQQEWVSLERLAIRLKTQDQFAPFRNPQQLPSKIDFEEQKEAALYGYTYLAPHQRRPHLGNFGDHATDAEKAEFRVPPNPFEQGGFIPTDKQLKVIANAAKLAGRENNPDDQRPYKKNFAGQELQPGAWIVKVRKHEEEIKSLPRTRGRARGLAALDVSKTSTALAAVSEDNSLPTSPVSKKRKVQQHVMEDPGAPPKKKHPNQYTKIREAEAAAAAAQELEAQKQANINGIKLFASENVSMEIAENIPSRKKQPNQHTKRREREEAERQRSEAPALLGLPRSRMNIDDRPASPGLVTLRYASPARVNHGGAQVQAINGQPPPGIVVPGKMSDSQKRAHPWKDEELLNLIKQDHSWLHTDPAVASDWKEKLVIGKNPNRTLAMLRKWDEWRTKGGDKRPRRKEAGRGDGDSSVRDTPAPELAVTLTSGIKEELSSIDALPPRIPSMYFDPVRSLSPAPRPSPLRTNVRFGYHTPAPTSPLATNMAAADIQQIPFSHLRAAEVQDSNEKVSLWQQNGLQPEQILPQYPIRIDSTWSMGQMPEMHSGHRLSAVAYHNGNGFVPPHVFNQSGLPAIDTKVNPTATMGAEAMTRTASGRSLRSLKPSPLADGSIFGRRSLRS